MNYIKNQLFQIFKLCKNTKLNFLYSVKNTQSFGERYELLQIVVFRSHCNFRKSDFIHFKKKKNYYTYQLSTDVGTGNFSNYKISKLLGSESLL